MNSRGALAGSSFSPNCSSRAAKIVAARGMSDDTVFDGSRNRVSPGVFFINGILEDKIELIGNARFIQNLNTAEASTDHPERCKSGPASDAHHVRTVSVANECA